MRKLRNEILQQSIELRSFYPPSIADLILFQDCQIAGWKPKHKSECDIGKSIKQWRSFDWLKFDYCRTP
jgi:hypothetical protein